MTCSRRLTGAVATLQKRKTQSAQYRYLHAHRGELKRLLGMDALPVRSTCCDRHGRLNGQFRWMLDTP